MFVNIYILQIYIYVKDNFILSLRINDNANDKFLVDNNSQFSFLR